MSACALCLRRSWLLASLSAALNYACVDRDRLLALLALNDRELIDALGGRRSAELHLAYAQFHARRSSRQGRAVCLHDPRYPRLLRGRAAPPALYAVRPGRLETLARRPVVAIVGTARASDYGMQVARGLARGLVISGVSVVCACAEGIALAAMSGACEAGGGPLCVIPGELQCGYPAALRPVLASAAARGCALSELPRGFGAQRWCAAAGERIVAGLAALAVVVEAENEPHALFVAHLAGLLERPLAAVPGRVTARQASGTNALLAGGARLVRGPADVLELLHAAGAGGIEQLARASAALAPRLAQVLERVGAGRDTPEKLVRAGHPLDQALLALSELELRGLVARGDGGRYVPTEGFCREREACRSAN